MSFVGKPHHVPKPSGVNTDDLCFLTSVGHYGSVPTYVSLLASVYLAGRAGCGLLDLIVLVPVWEVR